MAGLSLVEVAIAGRLMNDSLAADVHIRYEAGAG
jgi:hypothetical protein